MTWRDSPLRNILDPVSPEDFQSQYFGQKYLHIPATPTKQFQCTELFNWNALNALLNKSSAQGLKLRIVQNSLNYLIQKNAENLKDILFKLRSGGTLVLEGIDQRDDHLACFCDALSAEIGSKTRINLYLSCPGQAGYPLHYDTHDFFILQIYGLKRWEIFPPTIADPLLPAESFVPPYQGEVEDSRPLESQRLSELLISPGDLLYVPKGFWHRAMAEQEPSLHLTIGLYMPTGLDLMHWLMEQLRKKPEFRKAFPLCLKQDWPDTTAIKSPYHNQFENLKTTLMEQLNDPELLHHYHQDHWAGLEHRQSFSLPHQYASTASDLNQSESFKVSKVPYYLLSFEDGRLELVSQHQKLKFTIEARALLEYILEASIFTRAELLAQFPEYPWPLLQEVLLPLIQDGLIIPMD